MKDPILKKLIDARGAFDLGRRHTEHMPASSERYALHWLLEGLERLTEAMILSHEEAEK